MDAYSILLSVVMSTLPGPHDYTVQVMDRLWSCGSCVSRVCLPWDCGGLYAGASGFLPKLKVETNERDGKSQWITVRTWIRTHPTCQGSRPVLTGGEIAFRRALITVEVFLCTQCAGCPLGHPRIPSHKGRCSQFFFCLLIVLFSPFTISHDRTHLCADCFSRHLPFRTV